MSKFTGKIHIILSSDGKLAELQDDIVWHAGFKGSDRVVTIKKGTISDGISSPRAAWWFLPPWASKYSRAGILHDYLCEQIDLGKPVAGITTRAQADKEFLLALRALGMSKLRANICYAGVRGYSAYVWFDRSLRKSI